MQSQLEDPKRTRIAHLAVGRHADDGGVVCAAGAHDEFADAIRLVQDSVGRLRRKAFINMVVPI